MNPIKIVNDDEIQNRGHDQVVLRGVCAFCGDKVTFRKLHPGSYQNPKTALSIGIKCEGCQAV